MESPSPELLALSDDDLLASIGESLVGRSALPRSRAELIALGSAWFQANLSKIRELVCPHAPQLLKETNLEKLVTTIADMLAAAFFSVAPVTVAVLIVRVGVEKLCMPGPASDSSDG
jgi:hypothetical protein